MANPSLLILPGDGIGPEVMAEVKRVIGWLGEKRGLAFDVSEDAVGGAAYEKYGVPLDDSTMAKAQAVDAVLLGKLREAWVNTRRRDKAAARLAVEGGSDGAD